MKVHVVSGRELANDHRWIWSKIQRSDPALRSPYCPQYTLAVASVRRVRAAVLINELGWSPRYTNIRDIATTAWQWHKSHPTRVYIGSSDGPFSP